MPTADEVELEILTFERSWASLPPLPARTDDPNVFLKAYGVVGLLATFVACCILSVMVLFGFPLFCHNIEQSIGGVLTALATSVSLIHVYRHLRRNNTPLRTCTVRILLIVPIYAVNAWVCLITEASRQQWAVLLDGFREVYEAVAIFSFMQFVLTYVGGARALAQKQVEERGAESIPHLWPVSLCLSARTAGPRYVGKTVSGVFVYVFATPLVLLLYFVSWLAKQSESLDPIVNDIMHAHQMAMLIKSLACAWAMYNLAVLYHMAQDELDQIDPLLKFLSIKGIVFFTFWQGLVIFWLGNWGVFPDNPDVEIGGPRKWSREEISSGLKNFLLCIEMLLFSEMHRRAYPVAEQINAEESRGMAGDSTVDRASEVLVIQDVLGMWEEVRHLLADPE